jgi:hypothetical protein
MNSPAHDGNIHPPCLYDRFVTHVVHDGRRRPRRMSPPKLRRTSPNSPLLPKLGQSPRKLGAGASPNCGRLPLVGGGRVIADREAGIREKCACCLMWDGATVGNQLTLGREFPRVDDGRPNGPPAAAVASGARQASVVTITRPRQTVAVGKPAKRIALGSSNVSGAGGCRPAVRELLPAGGSQRVLVDGSTWLDRPLRPARVRVMRPVGALRALLGLVLGRTFLAGLLPRRGPTTSRPVTSGSNINWSLDGSRRPSLFCEGTDSG